MSDILKMQVIESEHHLLDNVDCLFFRETIELAESFEELSSFNNLRDDIVIIGILTEINDPDDLGMTLASKDT